MSPRTLLISARDGKDWLNLVLRTGESIIQSQRICSIVHKEVLLSFILNRCLFNLQWPVRIPAWISVVRRSLFLVIDKFLLAAVLSR